MPERLTPMPSHPRHDTREPHPPLAALLGREFCEAAPRVAFWTGLQIGGQGEPCENVYVIIRGQVLLSRRGDGEHDYALYLLGPGDLFGEGSLGRDHRWLVTARAVSDGQAYVIPAAQVSQRAQFCPQLFPALLGLLSARLERAHQRLDLLMSNSAHDRLLGLLQVLAGYHGESREGETWVPIRLTQSDLGHMVGLVRETVARTLNELEEEGAIRRDGRRGFWLRHPSSSRERPATQQT